MDGLYLTAVKPAKKKEMGGWPWRREETGEKDLTHCNFLPTAVFDTKEKGLTKLSPQNGRMKTEVGVWGGGEVETADSQKSLWKGEG